MVMHRQKGFTLIELLSILLIAFVAGSAITGALGWPLFKRSWEQVENLQNSFNLQMVMENITHDYIINCLKIPVQGQFNLDELKKRIDNKQYKVTKDNGDTINYVIEETSFIKFNPPLDSNISNSEYEFIPVEEKDSHNILKVMIKLTESSNESLTVLFTEKQF
ncbi:putative Prepilin-type N-terminal cleavage/methylation domain-containing protein [Candidatus Magnetomoraceae bacterium gMMP-15]